MRILVALDGSAVSGLALAAVGPWARACGAEVVVARVLPPGSIHETLSETGLGPLATSHAVPDAGHLPEAAGRQVRLAEDRTQALERARVDAEEALAVAASAHLAGVTHREIVEWADDVPQAVARLARQQAVDIIAMGTHGRTGFRQLLLGSVAESILRVAPVPVILVRQDMRLPG